jgi:tetraacyldisaccharide 4'-kinase
MPRRSEVLLWPLSFIYDEITALRNYLYDAGVKSVYRSEVPVISVGNLTVGGNGKTPLVVAISQILISAKYIPAILMRGYGGTEKGPYLVSVHDSPLRVGDEALLLARTLGVVVVVSRSRRKGLEWLQQQGSVDVVILDDGFQHRAVARDLDIVTHYLGSDLAKSEFLNGGILPAGKFRENRDRGLKRSDAIIFASRSLEKLIPDRVIEDQVPGSLPIFYSYLKVFGIAIWKNGIREFLNPDDLKNREVVGICGLGNPDAFKNTLESIAGSVVGFYPFPDHYQFSRSDVEQLSNRYSSQVILSTSKDMVKLLPLIKEQAGGLVERWGEVLISTEVTPGEEFAALVKGVVEKRK